MQILALANLDGQVPPRSALQTVVQSAGVGAVLFTGDVLPPRGLSVGGDTELYAAFCDALAALGVPVAVVPGERDRPASLLRQVAATRGKRTRPFSIVDRSVVSLAPDLLVGGLGGLFAQEPTGTARDSVSPEVYAALTPLRRPAPAVLLVHTPPEGRIISREGGRQVGRRAVNELIEALDVPLVVCGHAHDGQGQETIGPALVVNPGPLVEGRYAIIDPHRRTVRFGVLPRDASARGGQAPSTAGVGSPVPLASTGSCARRQCRPPSTVRTRAGCPIRVSPSAQPVARSTSVRAAQSPWTGRP